MDGEAVLVKENSLKVLDKFVASKLFRNAENGRFYTRMVEKEKNVSVQNEIVTFLLVSFCKDLDSSLTKWKTV